MFIKSIEVITTTDDKDDLLIEMIQDPIIQSENDSWIKKKTNKQISKTPYNIKNILE